MASEKALYISDCHIKKRTWRNSTLLEGDAYTALSKIIDKLQPDIPDTLLIGGDWFDDNRPVSSDIRHSLDFQRHFKNVVVIRGNHDNCLPSYVTLDQGIRNISFLCPDADQDNFTDIDNTRIYGVDNCSDRSVLIESLQNIASDTFNGPVFVLLHTAFRHLMNIEGAYTLELSDLTDILRSRHNVHILVGHIHKRFHQTTPYGSFLSPGSLYPLSSDDMGEEHFAHIIDLRTGDVTPVQCDVRRYFETDFDSLKETLSSVRDQKLELPTYIKVRCKAEDIPGVNAVRSEVKTKEDFVIHPVVSDEEIPQQATSPGTGGSLCSLEDAIESASSDELCTGLCKELVTSQDPVGTLKGWVDYWGASTL